jgi:hypothetical protein
VICADTKLIPSWRIGTREAGVAYELMQVHQTLRVTPAMEAGVSDHVWSIDEIGALMR